MNHQTLEGNLTADPELRFFPDGTPIAEFTVAYTPRRFDRDRNEWVDGTAMFMPCIARGKLAENIAESLAKGSCAIVSGPVVQENWQDKQTNANRSRLRLRADTVGASLKYGPARSERAQARPAAARPAQTAQAAPQGNAAGWGTPEPLPASGGWDNSSGEPPF